MEKKKQINKKETDKSKMTFSKTSINNNVNKTVPLKNKINLKTNYSNKVSNKNDNDLSKFEVTGPIYISKISKNDNEKPFKSNYEESQKRLRKYKEAKERLVSNLLLDENIMELDDVYISGDSKELKAIKNKRMTEMEKSKLRKEFELDYIVNNEFKKRGIDYNFVPKMEKVKTNNEYFEIQKTKNNQKRSYNPNEKIRMEVKTSNEIIEDLMNENEANKISSNKGKVKINLFAYSSDFNDSKTNDEKISKTKNKKDTSNKNNDDNLLDMGKLGKHNSTNDLNKKMGRNNLGKNIDEDLLRFENDIPSSRIENINENIEDINFNTSPSQTNGNGLNINSDSIRKAHISSYNESIDNNLDYKNTKSKKQMKISKKNKEDKHQNKLSAIEQYKMERGTPGGYRNQNNYNDDGIGKIHNGNDFSVGKSSPKTQRDYIINSGTSTNASKIVKTRKRKGSKK